jgi:hypothetical protein
VPLHGIPGDFDLWIPARPDVATILEGAPSERGETLQLESTGTIQVWVADCVGGLADFRATEREVTVEASSASAAYYQDLGGAPNPALTGGGIAWLINVPPPATSLTVRRSGQEVASARVPVRQGALTIVTVNYPQFL